jgi:hypothetical protein
MALTVTMEVTGGGLHKVHSISDQDFKMVIGRIAFDSDYASGGETFLPATIDLQEIYTIVFTPATSGVGATDVLNVLDVTYDYTNHKVICYGATGGDALDYHQEIAGGGVDLSSFTTRFIAIGY